MPPLTVSQPSPGVALLTLDDPARRNAMTAGMGMALEAAVASLAADDGLRCVVITGAGDAFSAGGDLDMLEQQAVASRTEQAAVAAEMRGFYRRFLAIGDLPVPVVAAVNGHAIGAGLCVALACDLVVVAEDAKVGLNFTRIGIHPGMGATWTLPRLAGRQRAAELLYTGRLISGADAARFGLALESLPRAAVMLRALALAEEIAAAAPVVVRQLKATLAATWDASLEQQLDLEAQRQATSFATADVTEGLAAARERREPRFQGR